MGKPEDQEELDALNEELKKLGIPIELTEKVDWKPGDPVTNTGQMMLSEDHEMSIHGVEGIDGLMSDARYTAPELFKSKEKTVDSDVADEFVEVHSKLRGAYESLTGVAGVMEQFCQVLNKHNDVGHDLSERIEDVAKDVAELKKLANEYLSSNEGYPHRP